MLHLLSGRHFQNYWCACSFIGLNIHFDQIKMVGGQILSIQFDYQLKMKLKQIINSSKTWIFVVVAVADFTVMKNCNQCKWFEPFPFCFNVLDSF